MTHMDNNSPPESLWHYTSLSGLLAILKDQNIWATDIRYLNDSSELGVVLDAIEGAFNTRPLEIVPDPDAPFQARRPAGLFWDECRKSSRIYPNTLSFSLRARALFGALSPETARGWTCEMRAG